MEETAKVVVGPGRVSSFCPLSSVLFSWCLPPPGPEGLAALELPDHLALAVDLEGARGAVAGRQDVAVRQGGRRRHVWRVQLPQHPTPGIDLRNLVARLLG